MLLRDPRTSIEIVIDGYQFPRIESGQQAQDPESWDSNWLTVHGTVSRDDATSWSFKHPCLTTWEVAQLAQWLHDVADGVVEPLPAEAREPDQASCDEHTSTGWLTFTEPNLSFGVITRSTGRIELQIGLSHEIAQTPLHLERPTRSQISITATPQHLLHAAAALQEDLATFPYR